MQIFLSGNPGATGKKNTYEIELQVEKRLLAFPILKTSRIDLKELHNMYLFLSSSRSDSVGHGLEIINENSNPPPKIHRLYSFVREAKQRAEFMKIFMGGVFPYEKEANEKAVENRLTSYHFQTNGGGQFSPQVLLEMRENRGMIMVDSGAFSVWTKGKVIDLNEYIEWIKVNLEFADSFVALDVIPGTPTKPAVSVVEKQESARKSLQNYHKMVRAGIPPEKIIHVLHFGEDIKWADRCQDFPYVGFGGLVGQHPENRSLWINTMSRALVDSSGYPINKWHLFGVTDQETLLTLPMYSADSAGWLRKAVIGTVDIWDHEKNEMFFIRISGQINDKTGHFNDFPQKEKDRVVELITLQGFTLEQLQEKNANARIGFNIQTWKKYEAWINEQRPYPWPMPKKRVMELF